MNIALILASVREGRLGERVGRWAYRRLSQVSGIEAELLDLKEYPLPFYTEPEEPVDKKGDFANPTANRWRDAIARQDGFVIVTPEYNHGYPPALKNALDYLYAPWNDKPALFVSYSTGMVGGARCVEQLREVAANLRLIDLPTAVHIGKAQEVFDEQGNVLSGPFDGLLDKQLADLAAWAEMLKRKRGG